MSVTLPSTMYAAAAERSTVALLLHPLPVRPGAWNAGIGNSVLQPLVVTSCPSACVLNVPSFHTASSYVEPLRKGVGPPTATTSGADAGYAGVAAPPWSTRSKPQSPEPASTRWPGVV